MSRTLPTILTGTLVAALAAASTHAGAAPAAQAPGDHAATHTAGSAGALAAQVRDATAAYRDVAQAIAAGYQQFGGCVSGPEAGAMGIHFVNGALVDDTLDVTRPEALIYEVTGGVARLVGVEYITPVAAWDASHEGPPVLMGQHLHLMGTPNRYRLPALYELHVWAWRPNPNGTFADWNPLVSCDGAE